MWCQKRSPAPLPLHMELPVSARPVPRPPQHRSVAHLHTEIQDWRRRWRATVYCLATPFSLGGTILHSQSTSHLTRLPSSFSRPLISSTWQNLQHCTVAMVMGGEVGPLDVLLHPYLPGLLGQNGAVL